ncbi:Asp-tRNA(Asn)/Glu-tRNA(Gln) amidotransferase subunit GatA [Bifidobacterium choloepi]|uniref:Glutamyl-tRNA(Gln) amidotransferase subunit A n=1 Tax=Bifidobacterium choloepi TaxID=2614131 RepID=A0A6I5NCN4_9BIFI|nr:Asp-tRNA(Asn)/Glu-tRNA(Gln) amidotransferase subunit GatA [Bifidobacterium choloepi]NEG70300.1 Asp-tRNA(Asn)/Glu-tRNA(Gln) amidotransferase subunit GatA [Bifidobacterium choloepi]
MTNATEIVKLTAAEMGEKVRNGELSSRELVQAHLDVIEAAEPTIKAFLKVSSDEALEQADAFDKLSADEKAAMPELAGVPIAVKDMIVTKGIETTAASKILEGWVPPYDSTVVERLKAAGMPILGKTNLDEFAMGSSTEHSAFQNTANPWNTGCVPGGSGGGSAAAVAAFEAPLALGTDTGGSIRQPGAFTGTVGVKPTYGGVSRYGAIAMASSLDQIGPATRSVLDSALLYEIIGGHDLRDSTSIPAGPRPAAAAAREGARRDLKGMKVGLIREISGTGDAFEPEVTAHFNACVKMLEDMGAEVIEVSVPRIDYSLGAYYIVMPSEASSNLARYDGMRYGLRVMPPAGVPQTAANMMSATREAGFGDEVKRRIILGTYALSAGYYDAWYGSAQKVRTLIIDDFNKAFEQADVLVCPTAPTTAFEFGSKIDDPMAMYVNDIATIPANLAGLPAMSIPSGVASNGLPTGFQFVAPQQKDEVMYKAAAALEAALEDSWNGPVWQKMNTPWLDGLGA